MSGLSAGLRALRAQRGQEDPEPQEVQAAQAPTKTPTAPKPKAAPARVAPPAGPAARAEVRETFSTKLKPSLRLGLKRHMLALEEEAGRRVRLEDVMEALIERYLTDPALQADVDRDLKP